MTQYTLKFDYIFRGKFFYAVYPFEPDRNETTMMKVDKGQVLRVVQVRREVDKGQVLRVVQVRSEVDKRKV